MTVNRVRTRAYESYVTVNCDIFTIPATELSVEGKALWAYLFSRPQGWTFRRSKGIEVLGSGHKVDKASRELQKIGLLKITKHSDGKTDWDVFGHVGDAFDEEDNITQEPYPDIPDQAEPDQAGQGVLEKQRPIKKANTSKKAKELLCDFDEWFEQLWKTGWTGSPGKAKAKSKYKTILKNVSKTGQLEIGEDIFVEHSPQAAHELICLVARQYHEYRKILDDAGQFCPQLKQLIFWLNDKRWTVTTMTPEAAREEVKKKSMPVKTRNAPTPGSAPPSPELGTLPREFSGLDSVQSGLYWNAHKELRGDLHKHGVVSGAESAEAYQKAHDLMVKIKPYTMRFIQDNDMFACFSDYIELARNDGKI